LERETHDEAFRKEVFMAVKILIKRLVKEECLKDCHRLLINGRNGAMKQKGYISSETWSSIDMPNLVTVVSMWQTIDDWEAWKSSEERHTNEARFKEIIAAETIFERYQLGLEWQ
jgi:heme-degrading monooxygenase HmoA